jgi:Uma2 family endonuclease
MATPTQLLTVADFERLPEPLSGVRRELHHGELIEVTRPKLRHYELQIRLVRELSARLPAYFVGMELVFRPRPEHEVWAADVGAVVLPRWESADRDGYLEGAPELVIEVLSPSNTVSEMLDKEAMCLSSGAHEFWLVDPVRRVVRVSSTSQPGQTYASGATIPLPSGDTLAVDLIFSSSHP